MIATIQPGMDSIVCTGTEKKFEGHCPCQCGRLELQILTLLDV